ncbi:MAG: hypothetical protein AAF587_41965 [Bacteroidota bacterium]
MVAFLLTLLGILLITGLFYIRYLRLKYGLKDSNSGGVQHINQMPPKVNNDDLALPGSRVGIDKRILKVKEEMSHGLHIETYKKTKPKRKLGMTRADLKRSYMIDALLERPKF